MAIEISHKIKSFRKFSGLSQEAFAQKLGVSFTTVNRWENGHALPNQLAKQNIENIWHDTGFYFKEDQHKENYKILLVDDEANVIVVLKKSLSKLDFNVTIETAEDGYEAGLKVSTFQPDLVILDIFLPGIRGDLVCQKIKQNPLTTNVFLIAISGNLDEFLKDKLMNYGADLVLEKPLDGEQLIFVISQQRELNKLNAGRQLN